MKFEINFNYHKNYNDELLKTLGAERKQINQDYHYLEIEFNTFEEIEIFLNKINKITSKDYSIILGFDNPTIFLDDQI